MAKKVKVVRSKGNNYNARRKKALNSKVNKKRKRQQLSLLVSCLMLILTICWYVISLSNTQNTNISQQNNSALDTSILKRVNSVNKDNSMYATGNYINVYNYLDSIKTVKNKGYDMVLEKDGYYRMSGDGDYDILQLTDLHITGTESAYDKDLKAIKAVHSMIKRSAPDFIILTGDVIFGTDNYDANDGIRALNVLSTMMDNIGIPWAWCFGNHDHSFFDQYSDDIIASMLAQSITLRMYKSNSEITGYTNGTFKLCNASGVSIMALVLLDSGNMVSNIDGTYGYDYIRPDQTQWYEQEIRRLKTENNNAKSLIFLHIPLQEYNNAWSSGTVVFGTKREDVCCSSYHSDLFDKVVQLGNTKAIFCGHDHLNDYGAYYNGVELVYGKSIDYIAYPYIENKKEQRGATLINVTSEGSYSIVQLQYEQ